MVESNNKRDTLESGNSSVNNSSSPEGNPFTDGKLEKPSVNGDTTEFESGDNLNFLIFLILILLLMGNKNTFNTHFQLINDEVEKITKLLEAVSVTNDSLKNAVKAPQRVMQSINDFNN